MTQIVRCSSQFDWQDGVGTSNACRLGFNPEHYPDYITVRSERTDERRVFNRAQALRDTAGFEYRNVKDGQVIVLRVEQRS